jgi:BolA protein
MSVIENLRQRLAILEPQQVEIRDDSARHAGHAGAKSGGHFAVRIISSRFAGLPTVRRHRLVYDAAGDLMQQGIHALSIDARTPEEISS